MLIKIPLPLYLTLSRKLSKSVAGPGVQCLKSRSYIHHRGLCSKNPSSDETKTTEESTKPKELGFLKYKPFTDQDATVIFDVEEEKLHARSQPQVVYDEFSGYNLDRGIRGVYDIEDLVDVLKDQKALDIAVIEIPKSYSYVDQMVIVTGKSHRHMKSLADFIRRLFKKKRNPDDAIPKIEGPTCDDWIAIDLGNIVLHIFSEKSRTVYDLESLWALGPDYDAQLKKKEDDSLATLIQKHSVFLGDLRPADVNG